MECKTIPTNIAMSNLPSFSSNDNDATQPSNDPKDELASRLQVWWVAAVSRNDHCHPRQRTEAMPNMS